MDEDVRGFRPPRSDDYVEQAYIAKEVISAKDAEIAALKASLEAEKTSKDTAYSERDRLVCAISKIFPSHLERHPDSDVSWENDWRWIVFVQFPTGQASWHIHDSEIGWFDHLERRAGNSWDGHSTAEKYARIERFERIGNLASSEAALKAENDTLRSILAKGQGNCVYCGLPANDIAKCAEGFPGCGRMDDIVNAPQSRLEAENQRLLEALTKVADPLVTGGQALIIARAALAQTKEPPQ